MLNFKLLAKCIKTQPTTALIALHFHDDPLYKQSVTWSNTVLTTDCNKHIACPDPGVAVKHLGIATHRQTPFIPRHYHVLSVNLSLPSIDVLR